MILAERVSSAVLKKFNNNDVSRVISCWEEFSKGNRVSRYLDSAEEIRQEAECFVEGLSAIPFHDMSLHPWATKLQPYSNIILDELQKYEAKQEKANTEVEWLGPRDTTGCAYGPEWKTLGLQDRSVWDTERIKDFPKTIKLLKDLKVPSCEVFFARQNPNSGILPHSDKNNFIITCHLGLEVPEGQCHIKVGNQEYYWKNGESVVFDTSVIHSTYNNASTPRIVLLIRFWHPELTEIEREAFKFIFEYLDCAAHGDEALENFEMQQILLGKDQHKGKAITGSVPIDNYDKVLMKKNKRNNNNNVSKGFGKK